MKKIRVLLTLLLVCASVSAPLGAQGSQEKTKGKWQWNTAAPKPKTLKERNKEMSIQIDSLNAVLDALNAERDSLARVILRGGEPIDALEFDDYESRAASTDSLISLWYIQQRVNMVDSVSVPEPVNFSSSVSDDEYVSRLEAMGCFFTLPYNEVVRSYIIRYSERSKSSLSGLLSLCYYYMPIFEEALSRYGLPQELKVLAIVESSLNPKAVSRAGAVGLWQFMYTAAKSYGLRINSYFDERMDPYKSADAAARYLRDAYAMLGDWSLAISSYNCGPGGVKKAIARAGGKTGYWDIYPYLPRETRNYVPAFVGMLYTLYYRNELDLEPDPFVMPAHTDTFHIHNKLHFKQIEALVGTPAEELRRINPQYTHDILPGDCLPCVLRIPYNYTDAYLALEDSIGRYKADEFFSEAVIKNITQGAKGLGDNRVVYKVKSGDTLSRIAVKYHVSVASIKKWNYLKSDRLRIGQKLYIYK